MVLRFQPLALRFRPYLCTSEVHLPEAVAVRVAELHRGALAGVRRLQESIYLSLSLSLYIYIYIYIVDVYFRCNIICTYEYIYIYISYT